MQAVADVHATPSKPWFGLPVATDGSTVVSLVQELPFQDRARVRVRLPSKYAPTATHDVVLTHDTPDRLLNEVCDPLGLGTIVHPLPFHISVSVDSLGASNSPTAMQNVGPTHDTASRVCAWVDDVLALGTIDHVETVAAGAEVESASTPAPAQAIPTAMRASRRKGEHSRATCRV